MSSVACRSRRGRSTPATPASLPEFRYAPLWQPLPLPRSRLAPADTALPPFPLRSRARPSLHAPVRLLPTGSRPAPIGKFRSRPAPRSRPRPRTPSARCACDAPGDAVALSAQVGQAVRTSLPARPLQATARALPALILPAVGTRQAERAPCASLGLLTLVVLGSACSLAYGLPTGSCLRTPNRLQPTGSQHNYPYGLPARALAPKLPPLLAPTIFRGARPLFLLRSGRQFVPRCLPVLCRRTLALCLP